MIREYAIEDSPFYNTSVKTRSTLNELEKGDGDNIVLARKIHFKHDEYVKVITTNDIDILQYHKLPKIALTVLFYIITNCLEFNAVTFRLKVDSLRIILGMSTTKPIYTGIKSLLKANYIARTNTNEVYWINHNLFYKGAFVVDKYIKEETKETTKFGIK